MPAGEGQHFSWSVSDYQGNADNVQYVADTILLSSHMVKFRGNNLVEAGLNQAMLIMHDQNFKVNIQTEVALLIEEKRFSTTTAHACSVRTLRVDMTHQSVMDAIL